MNSTRISSEPPQPIGLTLILVYAELQGSEADLQAIQSPLLQGRCLWKTAEMGALFVASATALSSAISYAPISLWEVHCGEDHKTNNLK